MTEEPVSELSDIVSDLERIGSHKDLGKIWKKQWRTEALLCALTEKYGVLPHWLHKRIRVAGLRTLDLWLHVAIDLPCELDLKKIRSTRP
jgi:hypothetical protein